MQLLVRLHFTFKEEITPEWRCSFIIISIISREPLILDRSTQSVILLHDGLLGVYMPGGITT